MGTMMRDVGDEGGLANALSSASKSGVFFWASWHEPSKIGGQMDTVWGELARRHEGEVQFLRAEAEAFPESCDKFGISSVPAFALLHGEKLVELLEGADAPSLTAKVKSFAAAPASSSVGTNEPAKDSDVSASVDTTERIKQLIKTDKVMLFMKGTPSEPKCKFSRRILAILQGVGIQFSSFNVLGDEDVRQGIKVYSDFPTFPQLYVHGELVGGIDIIQEMADSAAEGGDDLKVQLGLAGEDSMDDRCRKLISSHSVMLFMKGSPEQPRCGFSRRIVDLLQQEGVEFGTFDILSDEGVRQKLKELSEWPTYPQLYIKSELVGGIDIVQELIETGEFKDMLQ